jgi:site-specific DNA-methyltransferase (adenine-specific)
MPTTATRKLKTPYANLLPPLKTSEREALAADIKANGVLHPVVIDEDGNILDGHHRYAIDRNAPTRIVKGLSDEEKQAYTIRANLARRNLSPDQARDVTKTQREIAKKLRESNSKRWTQEAVGTLLGVAQQTVASWFSSNTTDGNATKTPTPDARVKLNTAAKEEVVARLESGETQQQIAADFGVCQKTVSNIAKQADEIHSRDDDKARKTAHLKASKFDVRCGDFRQVLADVSNVSLVLTDPPYPKEFLPLWEDLGKWAAGALADDGLLVAYSGQMYLPQVLDLLGKHLDFWWCGAVVHKGSGNLTPLGRPVRKVINKWKPLVMFMKRGGVGFQRSFSDLIDGAGKQKSEHNWQQHEAEAAMLIEAFTKKGELVVDPFAGSGGFCKAAHDLGRIAVGAEILEAS